MKIAPLQIGPVRVEFPFVLAPMAGYTDMAMRAMCRGFGCGLAFTEVANGEGIARRMPRTMHFLETEPDEHPVAAHLYGADPGAVAEAARVIESLGRFDLIDLNCGCPVRKIVAKGAGAALTRSPERINAIVRAMRSAVSLPITVKTRTGFSAGRENISEIAQAVEEGGAAAIFIHARLASSKHSGAADWGALARVRAERSIPVVGNGGVGDAADALRMVRDTGVNGVMIGRAAVGHPWIFAEIRALLEESAGAPLNLSTRRAVIVEHLARLTALKKKEYGVRRRATMSEDFAAVLQFRGHLYRYLSGLTEWADERRRFSELKSPEDVMAMVDRVLTRTQGAAAGRGPEPPAAPGSLQMS